MKKEFIVLSAIITILSVLLFTACGEKEDVAKDQSTLISLFGGTKTATVKGIMTNSQWAGVANKITEKLNTAFNNSNESDQNIYKEIFSRGVIYIVEVNPNGYVNIKTIGDGKTIYIALSAIDTNLAVEAVVSIYLYATEIANVVPLNENRYNNFATIKSTFLS